MKWEYVVIYCPPGSGPGTTNILNEAGLEGWELVSVINGWCYLKRSVEERAPAKIAPAKKPAKPAAKKKGSK